MPAARFAEQLNVQIGNELAAHNQYLACAVHYDAPTMPFSSAQPWICSGSRAISATQ